MSHADILEPAAAESEEFDWSSEFRHQYSINSRQLIDLKRVWRATIAKLVLLYFLLFSTALVCAAAFWFSFDYIHTQVTRVTVGPLYDFGLSLLLVLAIFLGLAFLLYFLGLAILGAHDDLGEVKAIIGRQDRVIRAMKPYVEVEIA